MRFYAQSFQLDGIPSETYNLLISELDSQGTSESMGSSPMDIRSQKIFRRAVPYFYGATTSGILSFDVSITSPDDIDSETSQLIERWLFSSRIYRKLLIIQPDMETKYYNCIFNDPKKIHVGNFIRGYTANVQCDSPTGWAFPKTKTYTYTISTVNENIVADNPSDDKGAYLYPVLTITMNNLGGLIKITNSSDNNRIFQFDGLSPNEVLTVDNSLQTVTSSTGLKRLSLFNKNFFRLIPDINNLNIQGNIATLAITYHLIAKI